MSEPESRSEDFPAPTSTGSADPSTASGPDGSTPAAAGTGGAVAREDQVVEPKKHPISVGQILAGILFVLVVVFIVENTDKVHIRIIAGPKVSAPIWVALLVAAVVGALIAWLLRARRRHSAKVKAQAKTARQNQT